MSNDPTGAVYEFYGESNQQLLKVYIFWGGFPDGAAAFLKVITEKCPIIYPKRAFRMATSTNL